MWDHLTWYSHYIGNERWLLKQFKSESDKLRTPLPRSSSLCEGMGEGCCTQPYPCICKEAVFGFEPMTNKSPRHNFTAAPDEICKLCCSDFLAIFFFFPLLLRFIWISCCLLLFWTSNNIENKCLFIGIQHFFHFGWLLLTDLFLH